MDRESYERSIAFMKAPEPQLPVQPGLLDTMDTISAEQTVGVLEHASPTIGQSTARMSAQNGPHIRNDDGLEKTEGLFAKAFAKLKHLVREEFAGLHLNLFIARLVLWPLPIHVGGRVRMRVMRLTGFNIGHGTVLADMPEITGDDAIYDNLIIGKNCWFNVGCLFDLGAPVVIGDNVSLGHQVIILTSSHEIGPANARASTLYSKPVAIGNGAWLGARITILPGVTIGAGAVIAAGSVVHEDVPPNTMVAGIPARVVKLLP